LPGTYSSGTSWRIRVRLVDPRTGRLRERNRVVEGLSPEDVQALRVSLRADLAREVCEPVRTRVEEFGRHWLALKGPVIDPGTYARYTSALEEHVFKCLGRLDLRELRAMQVQAWINDELSRGYRVATVKGWYRVFRTMIQDAIEDLDLKRDLRGGSASQRPKSARRRMPFCRISWADFFRKWNDVSRDTIPWRQHWR